MSKVQRKLSDGTLVNFDEPGAPIVFTKAQIIEAMSLGGYPQTKNSMLRDDEKGHIEGACALGMAMLNLGVDPDSFWKKIVENDNVGESLAIANDADGKTYKQIARLAKKLWNDSLDEKLEFKSYSFEEFKNYQGRKIKAV